MKEFKIKITETLSTTVTVEAETAFQAREIAEQNWKNSEYILDSSHFKDVTFTLPRSREYER